MEALEKIKGKIWEKFEVFPGTPVIKWEYAIYANVNNPYFKRFGLGNSTNAIILQEKNFEIWMDMASKIKVENKEDIKLIIKESYELIDKYKREIEEKLKIKIEELDNKQCVEWLNWMNKLFLEIYYNYNFYTDEYFSTEDEELLKRLPEIRIDLSNFVDLLWKSCDKILEYLEVNFGIRRDTSQNLLSEEVIGFLEGKIEKEDLKKLKDWGVGFIIYDEEIKTCLGDEIREIKDFLNNQAAISEKKDSCLKEGILKGDVASRGFGKGEVIKIDEEKYGDYSRFFAGKNNYVLVSPMTRPEIVPFLGNAVAIVTDEGGITCHAAIVARELGIPCVVGTKFATQVLNDGDYIEVDAEKGVIKILKKDSNETTL